MARLTHRFWFWALMQVCIVVAIAGWQFYVGVSEYLAHPTDDDLYAHTWGFQAIVFLVFTLPKILVGLLVLFGVEWFIARRISKKRIIDETTLA